VFFSGGIGILVSLDTYSHPDKSLSSRHTLTNFIASPLVAKLLTRSYRGVTDSLWYGSIGTVLSATSHDPTSPTGPFARISNLTDSFWMIVIFSFLQWFRFQLAAPSTNPQHKGKGEESTFDVRWSAMIRHGLVVTWSLSGNITVRDGRPPLHTRGSGPKLFKLRATPPQVCGGMQGDKWFFSWHYYGIGGEFVYDLHHADASSTSGASSRSCHPQNAQQAKPRDSCTRRACRLGPACC
jgi:hypothetical protein